MNIIRGVQAKAQKTVIYGPEGVGKTMLASQFPDPLFIDVEGSTDNIDVARMERRPTSWTMLMNQIAFVKSNPTICKTLVIDTIDKAEQFCNEHICASHNKNGIESFGWGQGYTYVSEELGRMLNRLQELVDMGINVVLVAHSQIKKFEQPDEMGAYDRYELKLGKMTTSKTSPLVKEWCDLLLFCNYKTHVVAADDNGKKYKAQGGSRVMYTEHHPAWDAKNRHGLPFELPLAYSSIAHIFERQAQVPQPNPTPLQLAPKPSQPVQVVQQTPPVAQPQPVPMQAPTAEPVLAQAVAEAHEAEQTALFGEGIPDALRDLMRANAVTSQEIERAVSEKGFYPLGTPIANYDPGFIDGVLVAAWDQVFEHIKKDRELPF
nr:MAG TPA: AAA domain protein [Caudoviricetes sp.]